MEKAILPVMVTKVRVARAQKVLRIGYSVSTTGEGHRDE
jgi:hypothetical protein